MSVRAGEEAQVMHPLDDTMETLGLAIGMM